MATMVPVGTQTLALGQELGWMHESTALISDGAASSRLQARLDEDGYLLLRGLIDSSKVRCGLEKITQVLAGASYFAEGTDPVECQLAGDKQTGTGAASSGRQAYDNYAMLHSPEVLAVVESTELRAFFSMLWGEAATTFDFKWFRGVGPGGFSGFHMDNVYMGRGSPQLHTVWIPWKETPLEQGGLVVLQGSNSLPGFAKMRQTYGQHDVDHTPIVNSGHISHDSRELLRYDPAAKWVTAETYARFPGVLACAADLS
jgi:ectoine hydroxylase-related dioxygenase (phytanoyl-CoA dioxygenase family)